MQTLQQKRAAHALLRIEGLKDAPFAGELKSYVKALPAMIHMNGLGQAAAFYRAKSNGSDTKALAYRETYGVLSDWLTAPGGPYYDRDDLLEGITQTDMACYRLAEAEALAYLDWLKKFADAFIAGTDVAGDGDEADRENRPLKDLQAPQKTQAER